MPRLPLSPIQTLAAIVPVYGHHGYIRDCIYSLTSQWKSLNQIIVIVDGDEAALRIVKECFFDTKSRKPFTIASLNENKGTYFARNVGLSLLESDAVSFCDADDMWEPTRSRDILKTFSDHHSIVNTFSCTIDGSGRKIKKSIHPLGGAYCYSARMIEKLGMFRQWPCSADSDMFYRAKQMGGHVCTFRSYTYLYRQHGDQLTQRDETCFGSDVRDMYESMWHDGTTHHTDKLAEHVVHVRDGKVLI